MSDYPVVFAYDVPSGRKLGPARIALPSVAYSSASPPTLGRTSWPAPACHGNRSPAPARSPSPLRLHSDRPRRARDAGRSPARALEEVAHAKRSGSRPQPVAHQRPHTERSQALTLPLCQATPFHHSPTARLASRVGAPSQYHDLAPAKRHPSPISIPSYFPEAPYGSKCDHVFVTPNP